MADLAVVSGVSRQPSDPPPVPPSAPGSDADPGSPSGPEAPSSSPSPASHSRRGLLALAGGGLVAASGCLSALGSSEEANAAVDLSEGRLAFAEGFEPEAAALAESYGEHGVWGLADGPGIDGPTYAGAYRDSLAVPGDLEGDDGDESEDDDRETWVRADVAAVVYRLDGGGDERAYRVWLWTGALAHQPDGGLGRASVTRVSVGATPGSGWTLADYAPGSAFREGPVPVSLGERGPSGRTPLPGGGIAPDDGDGTNGPIGVAWQGIARGVRSVNAVCEFRSAGGGNDRPFEARISFGVAGGRGVL